MPRVLIIEDEAAIRSNLVDLLDAEGFETASAENGQLGIEAVRSFKPDLVVCDVAMPVCDGWQVLRTLREQPETSALPVILLTARAERADVRMGMNLGADDYLTKPFSRVELLASIRARLTRSNAPKPAAGKEEPDEMAPLSMVRLAVGSVVAGRYDITAALGMGGMGAIYAASHRETGRRCAIKVMHPNLVGSADLRARFRLEATLTASIESDHIVQVFDAGVDPETSLPFIAMELLRGIDLRTMLQQRGHLTPMEVSTFIGQAALGLDRTHALNIVHRDLKPDNLFVTTNDDGSAQLKILDFGIAKVVAGAAAASATTAIGTPLYMAPEQIHGDVDKIGSAVDLYALGHIAFTLLVGEAYWDREAKSSVYSLISKICAGAVEPATARAAFRGIALPAAVDTWFSRAVAVEPANRFSDALTLARALGAALGVASPQSAR